MFLIILKITLTYLSPFVCSAFWDWLEPQGSIAVINPVLNAKITTVMTTILFVLLILCIWSY